VSGIAYRGYPDDKKDYFQIYLGAPGKIRVDLTDHTGKGVQLVLFYQSTDNLAERDHDAPYHIDYDGQPGQYYIYIYTESGHNKDRPYALKVVH
jgi:hypothetical protein